MGRFVCRDQRLAGPLGDGDEGVVARLEPLVQLRQQAVLAFEIERHLWNQREVHVAAGERRVRDHEAGIAAHDLDQADPVRMAMGLGVRAVERLGRLLDGSIETERLVDEVDVVVDRLWDADDRDLEAAPVRFLPDSVCPLERAVATDDEQDIDPFAIERVDREHRIFFAPRGAEDRSGDPMDPFDDIRREQDRLMPVLRIE